MAPIGTEAKKGLAFWSNMARVGSSNAISGLSQMVNQEITISKLYLEEVSRRNATVGIHLLFNGNAAGQILLAFNPKTAAELVDMSMGLPAGSTRTFGEMEQSVLGELGNIVGAFFLNAVADNAGLRLLPSPPAIMTDTAQAMIGSVMAESFARKEPMFVIRLVFSTPNQQIEGRFLVVPDFDSTTSGAEKTC
ncbi:MAG: chemotaxis protein CheC [Chloroflexi bacterium]|nr:chemotaxis protein CheC [Chloroflexota bacterium]